MTWPKVTERERQSCGEHSAMANREPVPPRHPPGCLPLRTKASAVLRKDEVCRLTQLSAHVGTNVLSKNGKFSVIKITDFLEKLDVNPYRGLAALCLCVEGEVRQRTGTS